MAAKFQNRIDYVNISAYGIGKVRVEGEPSEDEDEEAEQTIANQNSQENRILEKIRNFEKKTNNISYTLCSMA